MKKLLNIILLSAIALLLIPQLSQADNYSTTTSHWGFKRSTNHEPPDAGEKYSKLLKKHDAFYLGDTSKKEIYLTFDNGYENGYTSQVLDVLKRKKVPAAFFVTGYYLKDQPKLVKRMVKEGHIVGNHSWHHPDMTKVNDVRFKKELDMVKEEFQKITGIETMTYLRPPRGTFSDRSLALASEMGYQHVFWSLAYVDWQTDQQKGWRYAYDNIMKQIHPGAVLLLHSVSKDNADAMERVIDDLQKQGYEFKSLDDIAAHHTIPNPILLIQED